MTHLHRTIPGDRPPKPDTEPDGDDHQQDGQGGEEQAVVSPKRISSPMVRLRGGLLSARPKGSNTSERRAFSRGAAGGTFVEKNPRTVAFIHQNISAVCKSLGKSTDLLHVVTADATTTLPGGVPDLVFVDPPYEIIPEVGPKILARLSPFLSAKQDALVVFEMPGELELAVPGWTMVKRLGKGGRQPTAVIFRTSPASP